MSIISSKLCAAPVYTDYKHNSYQNKSSIAQNESFQGNSIKLLNSRDIKAIHYRALAPISFTGLNARTLTKDLTALVEKYQEKGVILHVRKGFISELVDKITRGHDKPIIMGITGESASGKTTIVDEIINIANSAVDNNSKLPPVTVIKGDNFFKDKSKELLKAGDFVTLLDSHNFDVPEAVHLDLMRDCLKSLSNNKSVSIPHYEFLTCAVTPDSIPVNPAKLVILDSLFALEPKIKNVCDIKTYVHISPEVMSERWFARAKKRGPADPEAQTKLFNMVNDAAEAHLRPAKSDADIVISGVANLDDVNSFVKDAFKIFKKDDSIKKTI